MDIERFADHSEDETENIHTINEPESNMEWERFMEQVAATTQDYINQKTL